MFTEETSNYIWKHVSTLWLRPVLDVSGRFNHHVDVAARTVTADPEAWERVGRRVYARRRYELDLTAQEVVERAGRGLSLGVLSQIENSRKDSYTERTLIALCRALEWAPDSIQRMLNGGEPVAAAPASARADVTPEEMVEDLQRRVRVLEEEIERWRDQRESTDESRRAG
jgi:transcriptional regulator with XRE-family HTH domain